MGSINLKILKENFDKSLRKVIKESTDFSIKTPTNVNSIISFAKQNKWTVKGPIQKNTQSGEIVNVYVLTQDGKNLCELYVDNNGIVKWGTLRGEDSNALETISNELSSNFGEIEYS